MLKKFLGDLNTSPQSLPALSDDSFPVLAPQHILASREILRNGNKVIQKLVCWEGLPPEEATWEDLNSFSKDFLNLEDKVSLDGGGIDVKLEGDAGHVPAKAITTRVSNRRRGPPKYLEDFVHYASGLG